MSCTQLKNVAKKVEVFYDEKIIASRFLTFASVLDINKIYCLRIALML